MESILISTAPRSAVRRNSQASAAYRRIPGSFRATAPPVGSVTPWVAGILMFTASMAAVLEALFTFHVPVTTLMLPFLDSMPFSRA